MAEGNWQKWAIPAGIVFAGLYLYHHADLDFLGLSGPKAQSTASK